MVCPHGQGGVKPVRTFFGQEGGGVKFSRFCADVLYGRPKTSAFDMRGIEVQIPNRSHLPHVADSSPLQP